MRLDDSLCEREITCSESANLTDWEAYLRVLRPLRNRFLRLLIAFVIMFAYNVSTRRDISKCMRISAYWISIVSMTRWNMTRSIIVLLVFTLCLFQPTLGTEYIVHPINPGDKEQCDKITQFLYSSFRPSLVQPFFSQVRKVMQFWLVQTESTYVAKIEAYPGVSLPRIFWSNDMIPNRSPGEERVREQSHCQEWSPAI